MVNISSFIGFYTSQVVQDFFHQEYHVMGHRPNFCRISSIDDKWLEHEMPNYPSSCSVDHSSTIALDQSIVQDPLCSANFRTLIYTKEMVLGELTLQVHSSPTSCWSVQKNVRSPFNIHINDVFWQGFSPKVLVLDIFIWSWIPLFSDLIHHCFPPCRPGNSVICCLAPYWPRPFEPRQKDISLTVRDELWGKMINKSPQKTNMTMEKPGFTFHWILVF